MLTVEHVSEALRAHAETCDEDAGWFYWDDVSYHTNERVDVSGLGSVRVIDNEGGEGQGDHAHLVFEVTSGDGEVRLFKLDGYYSSHCGTEWDGDLYEVEPVQRTITVYEKKAA